MPSGPESMSAESWYCVSGAVGKCYSQLDKAWPEARFGDLHLP